MALTPLDWIVVGIYGAIVLAIGFGFARRASGSMEDYFIAGRSLPWWLAGTSIAATWFATDAPLATAALVRRQGVYGNWLWWYEATGILMLTFFYARLWRRAGVLTDAEVIEIRYGGAPARALRCFSALYQGLLKNAVVMGWVMLAMVKFSRVLLGWDPAVTLTVCVGLALAYTVASGLWGVVVTDLLQFVAGMLGAITLAGIVLTRFGGPAAMAEAVRAVPEAPAGVLDLVPTAANASSLEIVSFLCLILILWLRSGQGDGYVAQRLFATRDEGQAVKASLWFAFAGTVLLTWPWIVVGLGSLLVFPPAAMDPALAADPELAYPMMIRELMPAGLRGLMVATFLAAFMSTMDTHLCWGASYMVNDVYRRFLRRDRSERHYVGASRIAVVLLAGVAAAVAWRMDSIQRGWIYIIELTAGVALVWLLRWYWWRVNAWAEIAAMAGSVLLANGRLLLAAVEPVLPASVIRAADGFYAPEMDLIRGVIILVACTALWLGVVLATRPESDEVLDRFYRRVRPGGWWGRVAERTGVVSSDPSANRMWPGFLLGALFVYASLLGVGYVLTGRAGIGVLLLAVSLGAAAITVRIANATTTPPAPGGAA
ncbi:sodium:solute symporter family protein [Candidatus Palauibacter sp.]|uniref:sodium:solute symporter family protein n=1 Tax=Candidatus Palauibacter sp. TaxID=3101350 RepID=UPI003B014B1B